MHKATVPLTEKQIAELPSVPMEFIPAPEEGQRLVVKDYSREGVSLIIEYELEEASDILNT